MLKYNDDVFKGSVYNDAYDGLGDVYDCYQLTGL